MRKRKGWALAALAAAALMAVGCGTDQTAAGEQTEGLEELGAVTVVAREDGSGTRTAFAQIVGLDEGTSSGSPDATTDSAVIADSTDAVIELVCRDTAAIGYISMGASDRLNGGKALRVNGQEATAENVEKGSYPMSRTFYLAYSGELSDLEQDFLSYVKGKGQEIVAQSFVAVGKSSTFLSDQSEGTLEIHGSTSAGELLEELAAEYMQLNAHAQITVVQSDSTTGLNDAMQGKCSFAMASRELKDYEKELLDYTAIAKDGIEVIVHADNPLANISTDELAAIYAGEITEWGELNNR